MVIPARIRWGWNDEQETEITNHMPEQRARLKKLMDTDHTRPNEQIDFFHAQMYMEIPETSPIYGCTAVVATYATATLPEVKDTMYLRGPFELRANDTPLPKWNWRLTKDSDLVFHIPTAPNLFHRIMQRIVLGIRWERIEK